MKKKTLLTADAEKLHAKYSASGSERWMNCHGSITLSAKAPEQPESPYAIEGTHAHECLEFLLKNRKKLSAAERMARKQYPKEMVKHGMDATAWILARLEEAGPDAEFLCESRVDSSYFTTDGQFGTLDAAVVEEFGTLTVIDYKYGAGHVVDPSGVDGLGNSQLVNYTRCSSAIGSAKNHALIAVNSFFLNVSVPEGHAKA